MHYKHIAHNYVGSVIFKMTLACVLLLRIVDVLAGYPLALRPQNANLDRSHRKHRRCVLSLGVQTRGFTVYIGTYISCGAHVYHIIHIMILRTHKGYIVIETKLPTLIDIVTNDDT